MLNAISVPCDTPKSELKSNLRNARFKGSEAVEPAVVEAKVPVLALNRTFAPIDRVREGPPFTTDV